MIHCNSWESRLKRFVRTWCSGWCLRVHTWVATQISIACALAPKGETRVVVWTLQSGGACDAMNVNKLQENKQVSLTIWTKIHAAIRLTATNGVGDAHWEVITIDERN